jgi:uncharacterized protein (TIGR00369 family)
MNADEIVKLLREEFPQFFYPGCGLSIERVDYANVRVRRHFHEDSVRPGGTISGPTMMELADFAMYVAVFSVAGPVPMAVTTNLNINFLRKPGRGDLVADAKLLKVGKRLGRHLFGGRAGAGRPRHFNIFDAAAGTSIPLM